MGLFFCNPCLLAPNLLDYWRKRGVMKQTIFTLTIFFIFLVGSIALGSNNPPSLASYIFQDAMVESSLKDQISIIKEKLESYYYPSKVVVKIESFDGRSLDQDFDSILWPRFVVGFEIGDSSHDFVPLFFGYAPTKGRLEIISLDTEKEQAFEFSLVDNFKPEFIHTQMTLNRNQEKLCMSCHLGKSTIFPKSPFSESAGSNIDYAFFPKNEITVYNEGLTTIFGQSSLDLSYFHLKKKKQSQNHLSLFADSGRVEFQQPFVFAEWVRNSNIGSQVSFITETYCQNDEDCFVDMLIIGLFLQLDLTSDRFQDSLGKLVTWFEERQSDSFSYPSPVIPDRVLGKNGSEGYIPWYKVGEDEVDSFVDEVYNPLFISAALLRFDKAIHLNGYRNMENVQKEYQELFDFHPGNPQSPRPDVDSIDTPQEFLNRIKNFLLTYKFGLSHDQIFHFFANFTADEIESAVFSKSFMDRFLKERHGPGLLSLLLEKLGQKDMPNGYFPTLKEEREQSEYNPKYEISVAPHDKTFEHELPFARFEAVRIAENICGTCHFEYSGLELPFSNIDHFSSFKASNGLFPDQRINNNEMPPPGVRSFLIESLYDGDSKKFENDLKKLSDYLKATREIK